MAFMQPVDDRADANLAAEPHRPLDLVLPVPRHEHRPTIHLSLCKRRERAIVARPPLSARLALVGGLALPVV